MSKNNNLPVNRQTQAFNVPTKGKKLRTIFKIRKHTNNYTVISNAALQDKRLSFKARGILTYLLSKPDKWIVKVTELNQASPQGKRAVQSALKELRELGYAKLCWIKSSKNRMSSQYFISEIPRKDWVETSNQISTYILDSNPHFDSNFFLELSNQLINNTPTLPLENQLEDYIYNTYTSNGSQPSGNVEGHLTLKNKGLQITGYLFRQTKLGKYGRVDLIELNKKSDNTIEIIIYELKRYDLDFKTLEQVIKYSNGIKKLLKSVYGNLSLSYSIQFKLIGYRNNLEGLDYQKLNIKLITYHFHQQEGFTFNQIV